MILSKIPLKYKFLLFCLFILSFNTKANPVQKIISLNLCSDILLLQLADESQQLSITFLINEMQPHISIPKTVQFNRSLLEEVTYFQADVILAHTFTSSLTLQRLAQLGWSVVKLKAAQSIEDIYRNINQIGKAIQRQQKALKLVQDMKMTLQRMKKLNQQKVLVFHPNGFGVGKNTLIDNMLSHLNLHNIAEEMGIVFWGKVSLERILQYEPEFIILSTSQSTQPALATTLLQHRVLQKRPHIDVANNLWQCGNPLILQAMQHIIQQIESD